jgi:hypothetical protein
MVIHSCRIARYTLKKLALLIYLGEMNPKARYDQKANHWPFQVITSIP